MIVTTNISAEHPLSSLRRRRRRAAVASVLFVAATSCVSLLGSPSVDAFSSPSTKALFLQQHQPSPMSSLYSSTSRRAVADGTSSTRRIGSGLPQGSPLEMICKDQQEFELQVGHAMDTLRDDYPHILTKNPDYSIYDSQLELVDPSGVRLHGVKNYKNVFRLLHAIVGIFYCPERSGLTFRMCFDKARQNIRIHWNAQVIPKAIFGGYKTTLHVDGISIYELDRISGNITQHRLERLVINDNYITPEQGIFAALRGHAINSEVDGVPAFNMERTAAIATVTDGETKQEKNKGQDFSNTIFQFQSHFPSILSSRGSVLFSDSEPDECFVGRTSTSTTTTLDALSSSSSEQQDGSSGQQQSLSSSTYEHPLSPVDLDALEKKNLARKKFGLKPMTPEEFLELQEQVAELDSEQKKKAAAAAAAAEIAKQQKEQQGGFFNKLLGNALKDTCETNFDCSYPEVCCDFGFKKMCCSSGLRILEGPPQSRQGQLAEVPVPANPGPFPPDDYYDRRGRQW
ncbi:DUF2358 domain containing protein [Nitzschia inconspicua]|uniref:DUF2358 domain containing protein n=1 Tax=Nitzschia inconspicua TaxID=303405 RepID=A0A9K3PCP6_9STRA|nr:DUF2358 domain containing protein [Nitzschia inconspicua]